MKKLIRILAILAILLGATFFVFRTPDTDRAEMITKYSNEYSKFVDDGAGGKIHYRDEGKRDGIPILLIHGSNSLLHTWEPLVKILGDRYRLISLDLHGHGLTGPHNESDYSAATNIGAALKVLDEVGVERAYWVGNSMGGWLTWRAGLMVPERTMGLVLIDASGAQTKEKIKPYTGARIARSPLGQALVPYITPKFLVRSSIKANFAQPERLKEHLVTRYWELLRFPGNRKAAADRANTDREPDVWNQVGSLKMPVLLLWGEQDKVVPLSHGKAFKEAIPGSILKIYPDAGHLPMEETPEQVARDIAEWIESVTAKEATLN
jgi:pimeloyl-ACP methyl ester carboxylesterase